MVIFTGMSAPSRPNSTTRHKTEIQAVRASTSTAHTPSLVFLAHRRLHIVRKAGTNSTPPQPIGLAAAFGTVESDRRNHAVLIASGWTNRLPRIVR